MGKTKLFIRPNEVNIKGTTVVYVRYSHRDKAIDISTGELIPPGSWDARNQVVKKSYKGFTNLNDYLKKILLDVEAIRLNIQGNGGDPQPKEVKRLYLEKFNPITKEPEKPKHFLDYWDIFNDNKLSKGDIGKKTHQQYKATATILRDFEEQGNVEYTLEMIDNNYYDSLLIFLYDHQCLNPNSAGNRIKHLKAYLAWCLENNFTTNMKFKKFKKPSSPVTSVAITQAQLDTWIHLDLTDRKELQVSRDLFTLGCCTGFRFSDFKEVKKEHVRDNYIIKVINKTKEQIKIPLNDYSRMILQKYNYELPNVDESFNSTMNLQLKEIAKLAGFFELHEIITYPKNKMKKELSPLWKEIRTHSARRSFATQSIERGISMADTMKCTGHKDAKTFFLYIRPTEKQFFENHNKGWTLKKGNSKQEDYHDNRPLNV